MLKSKCCGQPACDKMPKSGCSGCFMENYCSPECQKKHWKKHKLVCPMLKKLSNEIQPFRVVTQVISEILDLFELNELQDTRVLESLLSYAEYQFGERVVGKSYRERADGERITNWEAEYENILIINKITDINDLNNVNDSLVDFYHEKSLFILSPWLICLDSDANCQIENFDKEHKGIVLDLLFLGAIGMASNCVCRKEYEEAEKHAHRMLRYSKRYDDDFDKTNQTFKALTTLVSIMYGKGDYIKAKKFAEDGYNLVAIVHNPAHPVVQEAASLLIRTLFRTGDLQDAERFAEVTYGYLKDPSNGINQEGDEVAVGGYNYAEAITRRDGDLIKAEKLARESLRIREILPADDNHYKGITERLLNEILKKQRANKKIKQGKVR